MKYRIDEPYAEQSIEHHRLKAVHVDTVAIGQDIVEQVGSWCVLASGQAIGDVRHIDSRRCSSRHHRDSQKNKGGRTEGGGHVFSEQDGDKRCQYDRRPPGQLDPGEAVWLFRLQRGSVPEQVVKSVEKVNNDQKQEEYTPENQLLRLIGHGGLYVWMSNRIG